MANFVEKIFKTEIPSRYDYVISKEKPLSYTAESIQRILVNIDYVNVDGNIKVIQSTSSVSGEGKTSLNANIAYLLGQKGKKVILIDLDLRRPKINRIFNVPNEDGLTDYLSGKIPLSKAIKKSAEFGIDYLVSGERTTVVVNVLEAKKLKELIESLREKYDYIILDTPPVLAVSDALLVSRLSDGVIFVLSAGKIKKNLVKQALSTLKKNNVNLLGIVLTHANIDVNQYGYGYHYAYGYKEKDKEE